MFINLAINKISAKEKNQSFVIKPLHFSLINIVQTMESQTTLKLNCFNGVLGEVTSRGHFAFDMWGLFIGITLSSNHFFNE